MSVQFSAFDPESGTRIPLGGTQGAARTPRNGARIRYGFFYMRVRFGVNR